MPTPDALLAMIIFGAIGMGALVYGKKAGKPVPAVVGLLLMGYPYFVSETWLLYSIGSLLTACLYIFRN
ncbi:MAG: hypothetical protein ACAH88_06675 [Roseimicrobium sp.]